MRVSSCLLAFFLSACAHQQRFIYNSDGDNMFIYAPPPMSADAVRAYIDEIAATQVTTLFICPQVGMAANYLTQVGDMLGVNVTPVEAKRIQERGATERASLERAAMNLAGLAAAGHDPLGLIVERAREKGLEVFVSFRLNEVHAVDKPDDFPSSLIISRFWRAHPEWRVGTPGDKLPQVYLDILGPNVHPVVASWLPGALNFAVPEVRAQRLAELREVCERYPVDGLDLDFQRFPIYFRPGTESENVATMTAWMHEVRAMTRDVARKQDRPLLLSARILAKPEQNLAIGLDPAAWVDEGLIDFVTVSHYLRNDFRLPIAAYREILPGVPIYASIEVEDKAKPYKLYGTVEVKDAVDAYRTIARDLWADGADGILLFNFFTTREGGREPPFGLLRELGSAETILKR